MPSFTFPTADLFVERGHTRLPVHDIRLDIVVHAGAEEEPGMKAGLINGRFEVTGALALECPTSQNRLRPGMEGVLRLSARDGRTTRLPVLIGPMGEVTNSPRGSKFRIYHWPFFGIARPGHDAHRLFPTPEAKALNVSEGEISLEELIYQLGGDDARAALPPVQLDTEGGFRSSQP